MLIKSKRATKDQNDSADINWSESYHVRNVVRVYLIQVLIIDVGIGKVKPVEQRRRCATKCKSHSLPLYCQDDQRPHTHPSTRSPMLSKWPRNVRQWYCWLVSISDVFWTHTSARVCYNIYKYIEWMYECTFKSFKHYFKKKSVQRFTAILIQNS